MHCFAFFYEKLNLHIPSLWIRFSYADQLFASAILNMK